MRAFCPENLRGTSFPIGTSMAPKLKLGVARKPATDDIDCLALIDGEFQSTINVTASVEVHV